MPLRFTPWTNPHTCKPQLSSSWRWKSSGPVSRLDQRWVEQIRQRRFATPKDRPVDAWAEKSRVPSWLYDEVLGQAMLPQVVGLVSRDVSWFVPCCIHWIPCGADMWTFSKLRAPGSPIKGVPPSSRSSLSEHWAIPISFNDSRVVAGCNKSFIQMNATNSFSYNRTWRKAGLFQWSRAVPSPSCWCQSQPWASWNHRWSLKHRFCSWIRSANNAGQIQEQAVVPPLILPILFVLNTRTAHSCVVVLCNTVHIIEWKKTILKDNSCCGESWTWDPIECQAQGGAHFCPWWMPWKSAFPTCRQIRIHGMMDMLVADWRMYHVKEAVLKRNSTPGARGPGLKSIRKTSSERGHWPTEPIPFKVCWAPRKIEMASFPRADASVISQF